MDTLEVLNRLDTLDALGEEDGLIEDSDRHKNLLTSLGVEKNQDFLKSDKSQRSEATGDVSVYSLNPGSKVKVHDLISSIKDTVGVNVLKKNLSKIDKPTNQLSALLPKITADKVERAAAYEESSNKVSKWDDVVKRNRESDHLAFPLKHENMHIHTVDEFVQKFKPKTPLEEQIYTVIKGSKYVENPDTGVIPAEEEALRSVSLDEAKRRRAELQRHRSLLSFHEAKNRRLSKVKSKRHFRIARKQKEKKSTAEFEKLQQTDPEKAAEQLKLALKTRAEERAILRHRQGSKWAKNRMLIARYNEMTKVQLQDQKKLHGQLVQKNLTKIENSDDDEEESEDDSEISPLVPPTASLPDIFLPKDNPWLKQTVKSRLVSNNKSAVNDEEELDCLYNKNRGSILGLEKVSNKKENSDSESEDEEEELKLELSELKERKKLRQIMEVEEYEPKESSIKEDSISNFRAALADLQKEKIKDQNKNIVETIIVEENAPDENGLEIGLKRRKTLQDLDKVLESKNELTSLSDLHKTSVVKAPETEEPKKLEKIDTNKVFTMETGNLFTEIPDDFDDDEEKDEESVNRMTIQEAFADDDVVADFVAEKRKLVDDSKPKVQDLSLPGWGEWAGGNLKPSKKRRKRFMVKPTPPPPRKDSHLGAVIINENRDAIIAKHQVRQLPYGFTSFKDYERSIRQPIGKTWNTPSTFSKLTKPKVSTVMGAIIDPMDESDAFDNTITENRKRSMQEGGHVRFADTEPAEQRRFKRKKGNKKHKK